MTQNTITDRSYLPGLVFKCSIIFTTGILLTAFAILLLLNQQIGESYAKSFTVLAQLKKEIIGRSILIYSFTAFFIIFFTAFISLLYSHRVTGPLYRLSQSLKKIADGNLRDEVRLRKKDAIHSLAAETNDFISHYRNIINELEQYVDDLRREILQLNSDDDSDSNLTTNIENRSHAIKMIISKIGID